MPAKSKEEAVDIKERRVCHQCVAELYLHTDILEKGLDETCHYCRQTTKTWTMVELADNVERAFAQHYEITDPQPSVYEAPNLDARGRYREWKRRGKPTVSAIMEAAGIDDNVAEDIQAILADRYIDVETDPMDNESRFSRGAHYARKNHNDHSFQTEWSQFERNLKTEARYFSGVAHTTLVRVFDGLLHHLTKGGRPVVVEAGPGKTFHEVYRVRVFQTHDAVYDAIKRPDLSIGPPPPEGAIAGRMNAAGISVFYGAKSIKAAIAEVRPPVGSYVVAGQFEIIRSVRLLDVEALREVYVSGSIFDPSYLGRLERAKFLGSLSERLSRAVMPASQHEGYLVTQVISDYLANVVKLDGMVYRSVQVDEDAANIVLFHHAAGVESRPPPKGVDLISTYGVRADGTPVTDYCVLEQGEQDDDLPEAEILVDELGAKVDVPKTAPNELLPAERPPTLKVKLETIHVHHINAVTYDTAAFKVARGILV